ncbi:UDP-N-acetylmuramoyl-tripeptide--D-alanyl-D-alanine ligase [Propionibacteriaceae bacterium G57]|uniref:UDP-N-acetylmuramoyl-tripeptide--D-alanyl-D- alanine ligase n=1 Tax=Aestuariimicrobium sp. G57 TaxID=3418485 RepID=UPI003DA77219
MRTRSAEWVARTVTGRLVGDVAAAVGPDVVIDSRRVTPGALFVALPGDHVDGHDYVGVAAANGAAAALVTSEQHMRGHPGLAQIIVDDGVAGLSRLAEAVVADAHGSGLLVLAVTGSSGKTSTKDMLAQVLEDAGTTVAPVGSFNNEIGVPLTACRVDDQTRYLVSEMGARGIGHIAWLCSLVHPDISLVLNVGTAHLGEFGSVEGIAAAKGELVEGLGPEGWAVLNLDDTHVAAMQHRTRARLAWFSLDASASLPDGAGLLVTADEITHDDLGHHSFMMVVKAPGADDVRLPVGLALIGGHQVANAVAAAAAALAAGLAPAAVASSLNNLEHRSPWRMQLQQRADGAAIINDSYNANPDSMAAALAALSDIGAARRQQLPDTRVLAVLGDMLELGDDAAARHHRVGELAARAGVDELWAVGEFAQQLADGAAAHGVITHIVTLHEASSIPLGAQDVVLVKASRGLALDKVAAALLSSDPSHQEAR